MNGVKKLKSESTELPDCVISHIFSMLSLKTLVKTSALSKQWYHEWGLRKDLNFDLHNMFDYNTIQELPKTLELFRQIQSQFALRLDNFRHKYHGDKIHSIRLNFPLGVGHTRIINRLIHKGVVRGANRIELLFPHDTGFKFEPYKFECPFLSDTNSLTYLHLQNCHIAAPMKFSGLKNLITLVLHLVPVEQNMLRHLFLNCIHLENFTLNECTFLSDLRIRSATLLHLNIDCGRIIPMPTMARKIDIIASNLLSIEYSSTCIYSRRLHTLDIKSHTLSQFNYRCRYISKFVKFSELKNVTTIVLDGLFDYLKSDVITELFSKCLQLEDVTFKKCEFRFDVKIISAKLRHLSIINCQCNRGDSRKIDIDALNLSSFEYRDYGGRMSSISVEAPKLLKVFWDAGYKKINGYKFGTIAKLHQVENLTVNTHRLLIFKLMKEYLVQYRNLRQLKLFIDGVYYPEMDYFWILDIAMASQHLQKLSLTIKNGNTKTSHMVESQRQRREYVRFFHNGLKYVELHGCVCSMNVIELASHLLRSATLLKQITFSSRHNYYMGAGTWTKASDGCCWFERNLIHEHLKDEVNEQCRLIIL